MGSVPERGDFVCVRSRRGLVENELEIAATEWLERQKASEK